MESNSLSVKELVTKFKRLVISSVLFLLPVRVTYMFLEVSLTLLLMKASGFSNNTINMRKFFKLTNSDYSKSLLELPTYSIDYICPSNYESAIDAYEDNEISRENVLKVIDQFKNDSDRIVESMLSSLPLLLKIRLGIVSDIKRRSVRKEMVKLLKKRIRILTENLTYGEEFIVG